MVSSLLSNFFNIGKSKNAAKGDQIEYPKWYITKSDDKAEVLP